MHLRQSWKIDDVSPGTAGVWRIAALNEAGGWKDRTTVEDMDLAVRASLRGWKFVYLGSLKVMNSHRGHDGINNIQIMGAHKLINL